MSRFTRLFRRRRLEVELDAELRFDFDERVSAHIRSGMTEAEARRAARLEFGGLEQVKEECRDARGLQVFEGLMHDARYALRGMRRSPGFTAAAVLTLAVAIGINAAVFTVTNAVLFKGFAEVERNDRLLYISSGGYGCCVSYPNYEDWRAQAKSFTDMGAVHGSQIVLTDSVGFTEHLDSTEVSANTFGIVGQKPVAGRDFAPFDEKSGAPPVAILSYGLWAARYAKDPAVLGRVVRINGAATTIVGVMPQGFSFPQKQDLWIPLRAQTKMPNREKGSLWFAFGRIAEGVTERSARAEMDVIGKRLSTVYPLTNKDQPPVVQTFAEFFIGRNAATLYGSMWGAVCCVLLIACANLANLMLARSMGRSREMFVRIALGAGRRIVRHLLMESLMLSAMGGLLGWWIARAGVRAYQLATGHVWPWLVVDYSVDYRLLGYLLAITAATGLLFGLAPAVRLSRLDINAVLKDGGKYGGLSRLLVVGEMALAVVLLSAAGVMARSFLNIYNADLGITTANVLTADIGLPDTRYPDTPARVAFFDALRRRMQVAPGVESVAFAERLPTGGSAKAPFEVESAESQRGTALSMLTVSPGYFRTMGKTLLRGREFGSEDKATADPVVIVNERFASRYWPGKNVLGRRLRVFHDGKPEPFMTVVGVAPNIAQNGVVRRTDPLIYLPHQQHGGGDMWIFVRTRVAPENLAGAFRQEMKSLDSELGAFGPFTLTDRLNTWNYWSSGILGALFMMFGVTALLLASVGLYAVIAHSVRRRTREIGVRMAIGATSRDIRRLVLVEGMLPLGLGLAVGLVAAFEAMPILRSSLVNVAPADPVTLTVAPAVLIVAAMLGCWILARRSIRVDPLVALRQE